MIFLPEAENRMIVSSFVWTKHRNVTDRRTYLPCYYSGPHCQLRTRCKNRWVG